MNFNLPLTETQGEFLYNLLNHHVSGPAVVEGGLTDILDTMDRVFPEMKNVSSAIPFTKHPFYEDGVLFLDQNGTTERFRVENEGYSEFEFVLEMNKPELELLGRLAGTQKMSDPDIEKICSLYYIVCQMLGYEPEIERDEDDAAEEEPKQVFHSDGRPEMFALKVDEVQLQLIMKSLKRSHGQEAGTDGSYLLDFLENVFGEVQDDEPEMLTEGNEAFGEDYVDNEGEVDEDGFSYYMMDGVSIPIYEGAEDDDSDYFIGLDQEQFDTLGSILSWHVSGPAITDTGLIDLLYEMKKASGVSPYQIHFPKLTVDTETYKGMNTSWIVLEKNEEN